LGVGLTLHPIENIFVEKILKLKKRLMSTKDCNVRRRRKRRSIRREEKKKKEEEEEKEKKKKKKKKY
jgi:hypothetical protein